VQLIYIVGAVILGLVVTQIDVGFTVPGDNARSMLLAVATGVMAFIAVIYALLFLVVQFGTTTWTPRLNVFRDHPIVYHSLGYLVGVIVFCEVTFFALKDDEEASGVIPILSIVLVLGALAMFRVLQQTAFRSIQLAPALSQVAGLGRDVITGTYPDTIDEHTNDAGPPGRLPASASDGIHEVRWPSRSRVLQVTDVPRLVEIATRADVVVECVAGTGDTMQEQGLVARIHGEGNDALSKEVLKTLRAGEERTYEQDPLFAFRVLSDIALRALSPAVNDPATAVQALEASEGLLRLLVTRDLDVGRIEDPEGVTRVVLKLPAWEDYIALAIDEVAFFGERSPTVAQRIERIVADLAEVAPAGHREPLGQRLERWRRGLSGSIRSDGEKGESGEARAR
jgi:uncharacterized membrane protein